MFDCLFVEGRSQGRGQGRREEGRERGEERGKERGGEERREERGGSQAFSSSTSSPCYIVCGHALCGMCKEDWEVPLEMQRLNPSEIKIITEHKSILLITTITKMSIKCSNSVFF